MMNLSQTDLEALKRAKALLENPGLAIQIANYVGVPVETLIKNLPSKISHKFNDIIRLALTKAFDAAAFTMEGNTRKESSDRWHKVSVAITGGIGGFFGLAALSVELPVSTTLMLRSIIDIARSEGEEIQSTETKLACLEVFALGGPKPDDDAAEFAYYGVRAGLATSAKKLAEQVISQKGAPIISGFINAVAQRFGQNIIQKLSAQAVPLIGGAGGAAINMIFMDHYQNMARGHFIVRRLERIYGQQRVREVYDSI